MSNALTGLNEQQQQVVLSTHGPVLVLAGAGSGKTRALTHRIAHFIEQRIATPDQILAVTFTNKAAAEMRHRIGQLLGSSFALPRSVSTFHSLGVKILREQSHFHNRSQGFSILDSKDSEKLVRKALKDANYSLKEWSPSAVKNMISRIKHEQVDNVLSGSPENPREEVLFAIFPVYEKMLAEHNAYDFDDLLRIPLHILRSQPTVRSLYQARWRFISVDEYQDTNPMQEEIISHLMSQEQNICVVGDDYQSIYSWRGASVDHILQFEQRHIGCTTIFLTQNYRSTPNILDAANNVIALNVDQKHKTLWTTQESGSEVKTMRLPSDRGEAEWVCSQIRDHVRDGGKLSDCAVLYRTNAQSRLMEEQFLMHRMPYTIVGGFRFYDRKEIKDALAILSFYLSPSSRIHFERIADALLTRVGPKTIDKWDNIAREQGISLGLYLSTTEQRADLRAIFSAYREAKRSEHEKVSDLLRLLVTKTGYLASLENLPDGKERTENINELFNVAAAYTTTEAFLEDTALLSDIDTFDRTDSRVTCMTLHASKGLEYPVVFIIGCEEGLLPHENSLSSSASIEEERRLMYVGMTRAREQLTITHAAYRFRGGEMTPQAPSRFLEQLPQSTEGYKENTYNTQENYSDDITDFLHEEPTLVQPTSGSYVTHPQFGRGVIIGASGETITCVFEGHGVKNVAVNSCSVPA
ncbi:MAG: UvrD-helicase domain-containing protein [bacterium]|nr:UvrD-helicase domain-containing protein [bacterium]